MNQPEANWAPSQTMQPQIQPRPPKTEHHPIALFFHFAWKVGAILFYLLSSSFLDSFIIIFVVTITLLAMDFWTVKNVTGRKLVALRWWNEANESGSAWRFEAAPEGTRVILKQEKTLFWAGLIANVVAWGFLALVALIGLQFDYLVIPIVGCLLGSSNLIGYFKCSREAGEQLQSYTSNFMQRAAFQAASNAVTGNRT